MNIFQWHLSLMSPRSVDHLCLIDVFIKYLLVFMKGML
jgi:hypothetical protein